MVEFFTESFYRFNVKFLLITDIEAAYMPLILLIYKINLKKNFSKD